MNTNCNFDCDTNEYVYGNLTTPVNKYPTGGKVTPANDVHNNLKKKYRKSSSNRVSNKVAMLVFSNQADKIANSADTSNPKACKTNDNKSTSGNRFKHGSYERYLAKKKGAVLHRELCR
tara:strand:- start:273 stop:629 length:357 start_codon:yes stop_codon:yes gene_type:complete